MEAFETEREGQLAFYRAFLPRIAPKLALEDILADDNDGVLNGNLLEFKLRLGDLNATLFQCVKYLSARRIKGKPVPANIVIADLNGRTAYVYRSADYLEFIERPYAGGASKDNAGFPGGPCAQKLCWAEQADAERLVQTLKESRWTKVHIDENCIVGWAREFYRLRPEARKEDFLGDETGLHRTVGEIRRPSVFRDWILPYEGESNVRFQYLMDRLNDTLQKKNLGAFYTPAVYAEKAQELLRTAIRRVPEGNDYVIIDRCAGTGNLEKGLSDEELGHCILSTVEYYEYKVLQELFGNKVRCIIPPVETPGTFNAGLVSGADALSKEFVENSIVREYLDNPRCTVIVFENPPYAETTSAEHQRRGAGKRSSAWKDSWVVQEMKKDLKGKGNGKAVNELGNAFIWSAFKYYLKRPGDSCIVFSPLKYWKIHHLVQKRLLGGFACNRRWFHANIDACISVLHWSNEDDSGLDAFELPGFDVDPKTGALIESAPLPVKRICTAPSSAYYDKRPVPEECQQGVLCGLDGTEKTGLGSRSNKPASGHKILGYLVTHSSGFDNPDLDSSLLCAGRYDGHGFYLRRDGWLEKLPLFCMSRYISYCRAWTERGRVMKSGDGADRFHADVRVGKLNRWLQRCLLFTCLERQNHMRSFTGSDGRFYRPEICLDGTNGPTAALETLEGTDFDEEEKALLRQWDVLLAAAKKTSQFRPELTYTVYQIFAEIDLKRKDSEGRTVYENPEVHAALQTLKELLKGYYLGQIVPKLFEYEFLK
ncbi:MAG: hypothetical protein K6E40_14820 [Desulfovibrio sp.]|nr:hypothetical protein [Desulfovibrio sp.]